MASSRHLVGMSIVTSVYSYNCNLCYLWLEIHKIIKTFSNVIETKQVYYCVGLKENAEISKKSSYLFYGTPTRAFHQTEDCKTAKFYSNIQLFNSKPPLGCTFSAVWFQDRNFVRNNREVLRYGPIGGTVQVGTKGDNKMRIFKAVREQIASRSVRSQR